MPTCLPYLIFIYVSLIFPFSDFVITGLLTHVPIYIYAFTRILQIYKAFANRLFIDACAADHFLKTLCSKEKLVLFCAMYSVANRLLYYY